MDIRNFDKYKTLQVIPDGTLFGIEPHIATHLHKCPYCFNKLYEMRGRPFYYCKSKKHRQKFIISSEKLI